MATFTILVTFCALFPFSSSFRSPYIIDKFTMSVYCLQMLLLTNIIRRKFHHVVSLLAFMVVPQMCIYNYYYPWIELAAANTM